jgi:hypothetical protein
MRPALLLLIATASLAGGCSSLVAVSGTDLDKLATREEVRKEFGEPNATGHEDGRAYDDFLTYRKLTDRFNADAYARWFVLTCGYSEFITFPVELVRVGYLAAMGQIIRVYYDDEGVVTTRFLDGRELSVPDRSSEEAQSNLSSPTDTSTPDSDQSRKPEAHPIEGGSKPKSTSTPE